LHFFLSERKKTVLVSVSEKPTLKPTPLFLVSEKLTPTPAFFGVDISTPTPTPILTPLFLVSVASLGLRIEDSFV
jgi:hypothetical protein